MYHSYRSWKKCMKMENSLFPKSKRDLIDRFFKSDINIEKNSVWQSNESWRRKTDIILGKLEVIRKKWMKTGLQGVKFPFSGERLDFSQWRGGGGVCHWRAIQSASSELIANLPLILLTTVSLTSAPSSSAYVAALEMHSLITLFASFSQLVITIRKDLVHLGNDSFCVGT